MATEGELVKLVQDVARREVDRHRGYMLGLTASVPRFVDVDGNGTLEYVVDLRVGVKENQGLVKSVLVSQTAYGVVTDINIPVFVERSENGQLTVVSRASVRLPNVRLTVYSYGALGIVFASDAVQQPDGTYLDGFGYPTLDPTGETEIQTDYIWTQGTDRIDDDLSDDISQPGSVGWQVQ